MEPQCFCSLSTNMIQDDIKNFLLSLSYFHPGANVILFVDEVIKRFIESEIGTLDLNLELVENLNKYTNKSRIQMENEGIFKEFTIIKADLMKYCLEKYSNVMFLDSDIFLLNKMTVPVGESEYELILSPHYIKQCDVDQFGYFNAGIIWSNSKLFTERWKEHTVNSRFFEQGSLEDCAKEFKTYNFSWWRVNQSDESPQTIVSNVSYNQDEIFYKGLPIICVHTHFKQHYNHDFNQMIINLLSYVPSKNYLLKLLTT